MCDAVARSGWAGLDSSARACSAASWSEASDAHLRSFFQAYRRSLTASSSYLATRTCAPPRPAAYVTHGKPLCLDCSLFRLPYNLGTFRTLVRAMWLRSREGQAAAPHLVADQERVHVLDGREQLVDAGLALAHLGPKPHPKLMHAVSRQHALNMRHADRQPVRLLNPRR